MSGRGEEIPLVRSILIPLDGSAFAEQALPWAACLARAPGARLELVRVHDPVPAWTLPMEGAVVLSASDPEIRATEEQYLANCVARLEEGGFAHTTWTLLEGEVAEVIARHAEQQSVDLVVAATHGRGALSRIWLGSVSDALVRRLTLPLLLIRPTEAATVPCSGPFRSVLVALDGSTAAESALAAALELCPPEGAEFVLVRVVSPVVLPTDATLPAAPAVDESLTERLATQARLYLEEVASRLRARGARVSTRVIVEPGVAAAVLHEAVRGQVELIALATHGERGMRRLVLGSVADKILRGADRPVLLTRVPGERGKG
jgi:nucleotide-binding universal stress UspA family protein